MIIKQGSKYKIIANGSIVVIYKLYYQNDTKVCFYGAHLDCNGVELENPREYHLTLDKLKYWKEV